MQNTRPLAGCLRFYLRTRQSDRFLQLLGRAEGHLLARLDLNLLAGGRIAADAGGALAYNQNAEAVEADAVTLLEVLGDQIDKVAKDGFRLFLRHFMVAGERSGELLGA